MLYLSYDVSPGVTLRINPIPDATPSNPGVMTAAQAAQLAAGGTAPSWKRVAQVATGTNVNLASLPATIDSTVLPAGARFYAMGQNTATQNGMWLYTGEGLAATRPSDFSGADTVHQGDIFYVYGGSNAGVWVKITTANPIVVDVTTIAITGFRVVTNVTPLSAVGRNGAGTITLNGAQVGDLVIAAIPSSGTFPASLAEFASTITVANQISQTSAGNFTATTFVFILARLF